MKYPEPAEYITDAEMKRIRNCPCMICWDDPPSFVFNARNAGYDGWIGCLWPLCEHHRMMLNWMGFDAFLEKFYIER